MMSRLLRWMALGLGICCFTTVSRAQITTPRILSAQADRFATLEEQLTNRLRATANDQRNYLKFIVAQIRNGKLEVELVVAIQRLAIRRNPSFPFPFFERALRFEASRRGVMLPPVRQFATTKTTPAPPVAP